MKEKTQVILASVLSLVCILFVAMAIISDGKPETPPVEGSASTQQTGTSATKGTLTETSGTSATTGANAATGSTAGVGTNTTGSTGTTQTTGSTDSIDTSVTVSTTATTNAPSVKPTGSTTDGKPSDTTTTQSQDNPVVPLPTPTGDIYISPVDISINGGFAYTADRTGGKVYKIRLSDNTLVATYEAGKQVNSVKATGSKVYIMQGQLAGELVITDPSFNDGVTLEVNHTPNDIAIVSSKAYVANRFSNNVSVINLATNKVMKTIKVGREPMALTAVGNEVFVASHLPEDDATADLVSADIYVINTSTDKVTSTVPMIDGTGSVKDIVASPDGKSLYLSCIVSRYTYPTTQLDRGWINTNAVAIIDIANKTNDITVLIDEVDLGASNPWGIAITPDGKKLAVSASGTHEAIIIDLKEMNKRIEDVKKGKGLVKSVSDIVDYLPFLKGARTRIKLPGNSPRGIAINGNKVYIAEYFSGDLAVVDLKKNSVSTVSIGTQPETDIVRYGETLFYDATACYQQWQSCASCHPDARTDGFNWDNMNDGIGNPKSTKSMLYAHRTPPAMVTGIRPSAEIAVRAGMKYIQFNNLDEYSMTAIDEYLKSLQPEQSPYLNRDGTLTESAKRGAEIFEEAGCAKCHTAPLYTDLQTHNVKLHSQTDGWENRDMDTPTLVEAWRTGPYHYNGMFDTMYSAIGYNAPKLTKTEKQNLAQYVLSIGAEGEIYGIEQTFATAADGSTLYSKILSGATLNRFTVRKQWSTKANAKVTVTLRDKNGKSIDSFTANLGDMKVGSAKDVNLSMKIPQGLQKGSYLNFTISDAATGKLLATDIRYIYN